MAEGPTPDGVLLLDKPPGVTSTRALAMAKRSLGASKAGHTGTLDPFATGLLPLVFGEATKFSRFLIDAEKGYEATLRLGEETDTGDTESPARQISDDCPDLQRISEVIASFTGVIGQTPPMHSAVHVAGRRLYEYAREGREITRASRQVHVFALEILDYAAPDLRLAVRCSKGTYVRVLAIDIGRALGCGAYLSALRRTTVGSFSLREAVGSEALAALGAQGARERLLPVETLVAGLPRVDLDDTGAWRFGHGQVIDAPAPGVAGQVALYAASRGFLGVGTAEGGRITPLRLLAESAKSPDFH